MILREEANAFIILNIILVITGILICILLSGLIRLGVLVVLSTLTLDRRNTLLSLQAIHSNSSGCRGDTLVINERALLVTVILLGLSFL